jgi:hypothetical protein
MPAGPKYSGFGGYGPWPDNDVPLEDGDPSPHYRDGWMNRAPGGAHYELPTDYWLDCLTYPDRPAATSNGVADRLEARSRAFRISQGNVTGKAPGPSED